MNIYNYKKTVNGGTAKEIDMLSEVSSGGMGFTGLLTIVFITLKLIGTITWSWWWVLCPLWAGFAIGLGFLVIIGVIALFAGGIALFAGEIAGIIYWLTES